MKILLSSGQIEKLAFSPFFLDQGSYPKVFAVNGSKLVSVLSSSEEDRVVYLYGFLLSGTPLALGLVALYYCSDPHRKFSTGMLPP